MNCKQETYKRLGDYIREVDVRNSSMEVRLSQGICNMKYFQDPRQVSSTPHLDKIVRKGQFAYNRATTRNGNKISIAYREGPDCTVSSAYCVFYITDENVLNPYYLWLWFKRPDFDRYAIFKSHGSAHEFFEFETLCNTYVPMPPIEEQRKIVDNYLAIQKRIENNKQTIAKLEEAAQAIYRKMFVDDIDPENLPEGWRMGTLGDVCSKIGSGATPRGGKDSYLEDGISLIRSMNIFDYYFERENLAHITESQAKSLDSVTVQKEDILLNITGASVGRCCMVPDDVLPARVNQHVMIIRAIESLYQYFLLYQINNSNTKRELLSASDSGSTREALTKSDVASQTILLPEKKEIMCFNKSVQPLCNLIHNITLENRKLTEMLSIVTV